MPSPENPLHPGEPLPWSTWKPLSFGLGLSFRSTEIPWELESKHYFLGIYLRNLRHIWGEIISQFRVKEALAFLLLLFNFLLWKISNISKNRENSIMNPYIHISHLWQSSAHGQPYFICSPSILSALPFRSQMLY